MLLDALLKMSSGQDLTGAAALTVSTNTIDLGVSRDIAPAEVPVVVQFVVPPTSGTGGATMMVAVQTSADNATWVTLEESGAQPLTTITALQTFAFRGWLNVGVLRYLRMAYTPSAALTAGSVTATIGSDFPRQKAYPRNYVA